MGDFSEKVYDVVRHIPRGKVANYGQIARLVGQPRKSRHVGYVMRANPKPSAGEDSIPCHRVVFKDGAICEAYVFGGPGVQREMLEAEGVIFADETHVDMAKSQWDGRTETEVAPDCPDMPLAPPEDFDWVAELGEE